MKSRNAIKISKIEPACEQVCEILKSLSHPQRLLLLGHLVSGQKTVSELVDLCGISQSQTSQFLTRMKKEGLVQCKKSGRECYYCIADQRVTQLILFLQKVFCR